MNKKIDLKNILDIMYEPKKDKFSLMEFNGHRKEITKSEYMDLMLEHIKLSIKMG